MKEVLEQYAAHSIFARADWQRDVGSFPQTSDDAVKMIQGQVRYILHDPAISRARKMLVIEQFQNPELANLQTKQNYSDVLGYFTGLMKRLIRQSDLALGAGSDYELSFTAQADEAKTMTVTVAGETYTFALTFSGFETYCYTRNCAAALFLRANIV